MRFADKVVPVAGGTGGLGRSVTLSFLEEGADVCVTRQNEAELAALKHAAGANASRLAAYEADVTNVGAVEELIDRVLSDKQRLHALVNTVGGYVGAVKMWESDPAMLDKMLSLNLRSGFLLSRAVSKVMVAQGHGSIVNIAASAAIDPGSGLAPLCSVQSGRRRGDRIARARSQKHRSARQFRAPKHHRHRSQPQGNAKRRFADAF